MDRTFDAGANAADVFDAYPAPTFLVDDDVRLVAVNRSARALLGRGMDPAPLLGVRGGEVLHCVHSEGEGGCGRQPACADCVVRGSVGRALRQTAVHRARGSLRLRDPLGVGTVDVSVLVSASPIAVEGRTRALLTLEDVTELQRTIDQLASEQARLREAEAALRHSERRIRTKLEAILSPEGDLGDLQLEDLLDVEPLRAMMEEFHRLSGIPLAVIDVRGKVLVGVGWQDVCTRFHRVHPRTHAHCLESDTQLTAGVPAGEIRGYRCRNAMWDVATPIVVGGHHLGNFFMGQFFHDDEPVDYEAFRAQAARYGFDEREYLAALDRVPRLRRDAVAAGMAFFQRFAEMLSKTSYANLKLARSVAERERLMGSLQETNARLEQVDRRKDEFLAVLSHELRNPLAPIRNSLWVLDRAPAGSAQAIRAKAVIDRQVDHLTRLVDDLLDVTRISHGKIAIERARLDLRDVVRRTCEDNRVAFEHGRVELHVALPPDPVWVDADATRLSQAIGNVVQNAAKFTPAGGRVDVEATLRGGRVELAVRDTGVGIAPGDLARVFEPFAQADQGLARSQGGLGLGLALVRGLIEQHGGTVRASSAGPGRGATFVLALPLLAA